MNEATFSGGTDKTRLHGYETASTLRCNRRRYVNVIVKCLDCGYTYKIETFIDEHIAATLPMFTKNHKIRSGKQKNKATEIQPS